MFKLFELKKLYIGNSIVTRNYFNSSGQINQLYTTKHEKHIII